MIAKPKARPGHVAAMRAWRSGNITGLDGLTLEMVPLPEPGPGELLIQVGAAALNFSDLLMIDGHYQVRPPRPFIPGQEIAGVVLRAGRECGFAEGSRVASKVYWGGFAEAAIARADMAIPLPDGMALAEAVCLPVVYPTAIVALSHSTRVRPGEWVLVHGAAGGVGLACVQYAASLGARVIGTCGGEEKRRLVERNGAEIVIDMREGAAPDAWVDRVRAATGGMGVDVVVDPVGGDVTDGSLRCLAWGGRLLIVGFASGAIPEIPANRLLLRRASAIGVYWSHENDAALIGEVVKTMLALCAEGRLRPHIGARYGFAELPRALGDLKDRAVAGKSVLVLDNGCTPESFGDPNRNLER